MKTMGCKLKKVFVAMSPRQNKFGTGQAGGVGQKTRKKRVFIAMSGGVDSSVAAALLKKRSFDVVGVHMKCYNVDGCADQDLEDARRAAETLKIPFYVFDFEKEYKKKVVEYMVDGYRRGITPNPDVMCNKEIKFGLFLKKALSLGADYVATGHYVRLREYSAFRKQNSFAPAAKLSSPSARSVAQGDTKLARLRDVPQDRIFPQYQLLRAVDKNKDQSYFLWTLTQEQLRHCLFPIGEYKKSEVRKIARKFGLPNADKKDSQGICFLGQVALKDFLGNYLPEKKGIVLDTAGKIVGEHEGAQFYTIGQRHLGIKRQATSDKEKAVYVAEKAIKENALLVAPENDPILYQKEIKLTSVNFIVPITNARYPMPVFARVRYRQPLVKAKLKVKCNKRHDNSLSHVVCRMSLQFDHPVKFVASGQSAVFYSAGGAMLGGGIIA